MAKTIVITGASQGIGAELARRLAPQDVQLVLAARRAERLNQVAAEIGSHALPVVTDVTKRSDLERLRDAALERFGQIDVWINNAGRGVAVPTLDLTEDQFDEMIAVNLKSAWYGMQTIMPHFQTRGEGHVINVSSVLSRVPLVTYRSIYSASKAALNSLTANVRMDLREYPNIHISLVMPGPVSTEFANNALGSTPGVSGRVLRMETPEQVAAAIESVIHNPVPEIYTNPASAEIVQKYFRDVAAFEDELYKPKS